MAHGSLRHFLSPKLFYFYLLYSQSWLFQLSHNNALISPLVPFSAPTSTGSQTNICNDLATIFTKLFPQWLKVLLKFTSYRSLFYLKETWFLESHIWPSIVTLHSQGFYVTKCVAVTSTSYWTWKKLSSSKPSQLGSTIDCWFYYYYPTSF